MRYRPKEPVESKISERLEAAQNRANTQNKPRDGPKTVSELMTEKTETESQISSIGNIAELTTQVLTTL